MDDNNNAELAKQVEAKGERPLREWTQFQLGEEITVKGIVFRVHDVSDQRLVLKFARKA